MSRSLLASLLVVAVSVAGCDSLLEPEPLGVIVLENQIATPQGAESYVNGFYEQLHGIYASFQAPMINVLEATTDDGWPRAQYLGGYKERDLDGSEGELNSLWAAQLTTISRINLYFDLEGNIDWTGEGALRDQLLGEAHFFRAFYYFNLVRVFGEVPIYTEPARAVTDAQRPRDPVDQVYAQIKSDLSAAVGLLPDTQSGDDAGRVTAHAARAVLGKVHLTLEEWQDVLTVTGGITGKSLLPDYIDNFYGLAGSTRNENGSESILEVQLTELGEGPKSQVRISYSPQTSQGQGLGQILPTSIHYADNPLVAGARGPNGFEEAFEEGDARRAVLLNTYDLRNPTTDNYFLPDGEDENGLDTPDVEPHVYKWWSDAPGDETRWNVPLYRWAEVLLMRAEALNELGQDGAALALVDEVRTRARLPALASDGAPDDNASVRAAIRQERRIELAFEYKRLFDLNRWGILTDRLALQGIQIDPAKVTPHPITGKPEVLFPVPSNELDDNPNATQNAGY